MMAEALINAENLTKTYQLGTVEVQAVGGISVKIKQGELVSIVGASGSGKSTFMHLLGCLDEPTSGNYLLDGTDVSKLKDKELAKVRNKKIGFVFQTFNLLPHLTVLENVILPAKYDSSANLNQVKKKAVDLLERFGLGKRLSNLITQLSGGEMQRVAIARALINDPVIILADEPTGNLDSKTGLEIIKILKGLNRENNVTEVIVTHDLNITRFTERTIKIKDGLVESEEINKVVEEVEEEGE
jgi:putative ABC transport system ATP-binding protein